MDIKNSQHDEKMTEHTGLAFEVVEHEQIANTKVLKKGIYIVPNTFTLLSLLSGFYSILASSQGNFKHATFAIFFSAIMDGMDGRVARFLNAQSPFGEQFDSLTDCIAFGLAPAVLIYHYHLHGLGRLGIACAFVYVACATMRLARFNVQIGVVDKKYFIGVASPLAAILIVTFVMVNINHNLLPQDQMSSLIISAVWTVIIGLLMVSNLKYHSFKEFNKKRVPFVALIAIVLLLGMVIYDIPVGLLAISVLYALSGIVSAIWQQIKN